MVQQLLILVVLLFTVLNSSAQSVSVHLFSVSKTKKVIFSPGNLQYNMSTHKFQFAASQTEYKGTDQTTIKDLFGWGMWLDEFATDESKITSTKTDNSKYAPELDANNEFKNNQTTVNGTEWFTLSNVEWNYLFGFGKDKKRRNAKDKYGVATINGVNGMIILPDEFVLPEGVIFESGVAEYYGADYYKTKNEYTAEDWAKLEKNGAVFLPVCGYRYGTDVLNVAEGGFCWSSTASYAIGAYYQNFYSDCAYWYWDGRYLGFAVRLVRVLQD